MITNDLLTQITWEKPPLCWLTPEQQLQIKDQSKSQSYSLGEVIWSTEISDRHFLVLSGKVRLVPNDGKPIVLEQGDWFGDLLGLTDAWKARAASKEAVVLEWNTTAWEQVSSAEIQQFWAGIRSRYQPNFSLAPQPISGYPFVAGINTAAACLTMVAHRRVAARLPVCPDHARPRRPRPAV